MAVKSYQLAATVTATANAIAQITIRRDCRLISCLFSCGFDGPADNARASLSLSVAPTSQILINDGQGTIATLEAITNVSTSGGGQGGINCFVPLPGIPMRQGDILYLHGLVAGTVSAPTTVVLMVDER